MKHLGSVTDIHGGKIAPVDIITFGSPCQDLSVAGKRAGLEGERSGLFNEAVRIIREMQSATNREYPKVCIWENVPGALSSCQGNDIITVLDSLEELGFVVDMNILDAQYMGVPQRRRRIFAVWVSVNYILQNRTILSASIITQLIIEILHYVLIEQLRASGIELQKSDYPLKKDVKDGLLRRMKLFGIKTEENWLMLLENLVETLMKHLLDHKKLEPHLEMLITDLQRDMQLEDHQTRMVSEKRYLGTLRSWKIIWGEAYNLANSSTTLTPINNTTQSTIYTCSLLSLNIAELIVQLRNSYQDFYSSESLLLTVIKECMNYARQSSNNLFTELEWIQRWNDYLERVSGCAKQLERHFRGERAGEILFEPEGVPGNITESRKTREEVATGAGDGIEATILFEPRTQDGCLRIHRGGISPTLNTAQGGQRQPCVAQPITISAKQQSLNIATDLANTLGANDYKEPQVVFYESGPGWISEGVGCLRAEGENRPSRPTHTILEPIAFNGRQDPVSGSVTGALDTDRATQCVAQYVTTGTGRRYDPESETLIITKPIPINDKATRHMGGGSTRNADGSGNGLGIGKPGDPSPTLTAGDRHAIAYDPKDLGRRPATFEDVSPTLKARAGNGGNNVPVTQIGYAVRRLTPLECERLQGLPDGWTNIPGASDTARYKAIGNGLAQPCPDWIMQRIAAVLGLKTMGSLFDGIAGFPLAGKRARIKTLWASEIESFCIRVSQKHFPEER